jgi:TatD DNase family protein
MRVELYATVGCHPTSTNEISKRGEDEYFQELEGVIQNEVKKGQQSRLVAIGEIGLGEQLFFRI